MTFDDVAERAGVRVEDVGAIFHRKDCLLTAIVDRAAALFTLPLDEAPNVDGDHDRLEALLTRQLHLVDENREVFLVAILRLLRPSEHPGTLPPLATGLSRLEHYFSRFDDWLEVSVSARRSGSPMLTGHVAGGAVVGMLTRWASNGGVERAADWSRPLASMLVR